MQVWANPKVTAKQLVKLRQSVAKLLSESTGEQWKYAPKGTGMFRDHHIKGPGGAEINIEHSQNKNGQIVVTGWSATYGDVPAYVRAPKMPYIHVAFERGPLVLFTEIQRRFMPEFRVAVKAADQYIAARDINQREQADLFRQIKAVLGNQLGGTRNEEKITREEGTQAALWTRGNDPFRVEITVLSATSVTFAIDVKEPVVAVQIARFLTGL